jgi:hypothetical protein
MKADKVKKLVEVLRGPELGRLDVKAERVEEGLQLTVRQEMVRSKECVCVRFPGCAAPPRQTC